MSVLTVGMRVEVEGIPDWMDPVIGKLPGDGFIWVEELPFRGATVRCWHKVAADKVRRREARVEFNEREMYILRAVFAGNCDPGRLTEGGDYAYVIWGKELTREEMDAFLKKLEIP